jgi:hypothetical protein
MMVRHLGWPCSGGATKKRLAGWLAVLAVVLQTTLFDFAMAARARAAAQQRAEPAQHAHHGSSQGGQDAPDHEHGSKECPFCLARATHQAASLPPSIDVLPPSVATALTTYLPRQRVRARRRPTRFRSRSPPREPRR